MAKNTRTSCPQRDAAALWALALALLSPPFVLKAKVEGRRQESATRRYTLPDPLKSASGARVTAAEWRNHRRAEVLALFRDQIYGRSPGRPDGLRFKVVEEDADALGGAARRREVDITVQKRGETFPFRLTIYLPKTSTKPVPLFLLLNHRGTVASQVNNPFFPVNQILARGYGAAGITVGQLAPDDPKSYRQGVIGFYDGAEEQSPNAWRTISAWAWGGQRAMDYLVTDKDVDASRIAVIGHSRGGKAALWCGAQDERFALTVSNNSGESGAALARRIAGETVAKINTAFPHWFAENYKRYNDREDELPVDQHELIALVAPRLAYVASAQDDAWADPLGEFLACVNASPVFQLLGAKGLETSQFPQPEQPLHAGSIGYQLRKGGHGLTEYDWQRFMDFADRHLRRAK